MVMSHLMALVLVVGLFIGLVNVDPVFAAPIVPPSVKTTLTKPVDKAAPKAIVPKAEVSLGEKIFTGNCAACHIGGNNVILAEKNLSKAALEQYAMNSVAAIKTQVTGEKMRCLPLVKTSRLLKLKPLPAMFLPNHNWIGEAAPSGYIEETNSITGKTIFGLAWA